MKSMTGYGVASGEVGSTSLSVEIRSVNQRNFDLKLNAPREYGPWEAELRHLVSDVVARGRVEVYVGRNAGPRSGSITVRTEVAREHLEAWRRLRDELGLEGDVDLSFFQGRNDIFVTEERRADPADEIETVKALLVKALDAHTKERVREGKHLARDMKERVRKLDRIAKDLARAAKGRSKAMKEKLERRIAELLGSAVDPERLAHEVAFAADRADVTEELVRLRSHIPALADLLKGGEPVAKRIDFVLQEVNRELNTVGSKSGDLDITNLVVSGKAEVEKLREQVQNVE